MLYIERGRDNKEEESVGEKGRTGRPRMRAQERLQWDRVREKQVLLVSEGVLELNRSAGAILELCDGQRSVSEIICTLKREYQQVVDQEV